jgi:hypothetical protein
MVRQVSEGKNQMEAKQCGFKTEAASKSWGNHGCTLESKIGVSSQAKPKPSV